MDDVEGGAALDGVGCAVRVDVELWRQSGNQRGDMLEAEIHYQIRILGRTRDAVQGAGERAAKEVGDRKVVESPRHGQDYGEGVRQLHQYPSISGSQSNASIRVSRGSQRAARRRRASRSERFGP